MSRRRRDIPAVVRELCLGLPGTEEREAHGQADFRAAGRTFATLALNHHGDGRVALWLNAATGAAAFHVEADPQHYFVPPYVGPRGWLGVELDGDLGWDAVARRVREAWRVTVPPALAQLPLPELSVEPPTAPLDPEIVDPYAPAAVQRALRRLRSMVDHLPEVTEDRRFGDPVWRAGRKVFLSASRRPQEPLTLQFWVGPERQGLLADLPQFQVPAYLGHNGWISMTLGETPDWGEIGRLLELSYRHFALKRMLRVLDAAAGGG